MRRPLFIRPLTRDEQHRLEEGLRSSDAFVLRRCQILLASARGKTAPQIAAALGCDDETVRDAIRAFHAKGVEALQAGSKRPHRTRAAFGPTQAEQLRALLHQSPRRFGKDTSLWTRTLAAEVAFEQGLTRQRVSGEAIRLTLGSMQK